MRVCLIGNLPPVYGGVTTTLLNLIKYLGKQGVCVSVIGFSTDTECAKETLRRYGVKKALVIPKRLMRLWLLPYLSLKMALFLKKTKADVIHSVEVYPSGQYLLVGKLLLKKPFFANVSGSDVLYANDSIRKYFFVKATLIRCSEVIIPTEKLRGIVGLFNRKIRKIPTAVDTEMFKPGKGKKKDVGYIGRIEEIKGAHLLLDIILPVVKETGVIGRIVGEGTLKHKLQVESNRLGISDKIKIYSAKYEQIPKVLEKMRILLLPSISEGLPNILLEAMATGTIVLATPVGGVRDIVKNKKNGYVAKIPDFKKRLLQIMGGQDSKVCKNAIKTAEKFAWNKMIQRYMRAYERAVRR